MNRSGTIVACGLLLAVVGLITAPSYGCSDLPAPEDGSARVVGYDDGSLVWSPDGVNECRIDATIALVPAGIVGVALGTYRAIATRSPEGAV